MGNCNSDLNVSHTKLSKKYLIVSKQSIVYLLLFRYMCLCVWVYMHYIHGSAKEAKGTLDHLELIEVVNHWI